METLGISWFAALAGLSVAAVALTGLFFLKPRRRERRVPSVMLFVSAHPGTQRRVLLQRWSRIPHFLLLLLLLSAITAALLEPVWKKTDIPVTLIVADQSAEREAQRFAARQDPLTPPVVTTRSAGVTDRSNALWSALQRVDGDREKRLVYFGSTAPPWLPENGFWIQTDETTQTVEQPNYKLFFESAGNAPVIPPGMESTPQASGADAIFRTAPENTAPWPEIFHKIRARHGAFHDLLQHQEIPATAENAIPRSSGGFRLAAGLWFLGLLAFLLDGWLFSRGKVA